MTSLPYIANAILADDLGPILLTFINLIPAGINDCIDYKCGVKILSHSQTSTVQHLMFGNG